MLIEYEDMFPYFGPLRNLSAKNSYTTKDIQTMLVWADQNDLEVIPLIQTFGHMEFILKHKDFSFLRDNPDMPESICACHEKAMDLIIDYIDQVHY